MVLKTESHPTNSRSAKMNPRDLKIKQIVETTRCTHSEAEEALAENNNELEAAVAWILDTTGDNVWTETKGRKTKKTEPVVFEEKPERPPRGESGNRRGGKRGGGASRGASNKVDWKPGQVFTRTETSVTAKTPSAAATTNATAPPSATTNASTTASTTNNGVTTAPTSTNTAASASAPKPAPVIKTAAGPMSFAAVCAAGGKKSTPPPPAAPAPSSSTAAPKPSTPAATPVKHVQSPQVTAPSSATKESSPAPKETPVKELPSVSKPEPVAQIPETSSHNRFNDVQSLTSQLKNDLGLGQQKPPTSTLISSSPSVPARGTVEFLSDLNTNKSFDYHFGFNPESSAAVEESSFKSSSGGVPMQNDFSRSHENDVYKTSNVDSSANKPLASAVSQMSNSYGIPSQQQQQQSTQPSQSQQQQQQQRRTFGFAETSSVSLIPDGNKPSVNSTPVAPVTTTSTLSNYTKPAVTSQSSYSHSQPTQQVQQPLHQQHTSQQQMYNPMYGAHYPYVNLYSPVAGRAEDTPYATPYHMPYAAYGMDVSSLAQMMPHMPMQAAIPSHHQQQQASHRGDHHQTFNDMKQNYGQNASSNQNSSTGNSSAQRDANITSSNVPPPPGFSGPPANHMFHNQAHLQSMFPYPAAMFMQKMPGQIYGQNVDDSMDRHQNQAKMYGQQDKYSNGSNVRDRMGNPQSTAPQTQGAFGQQNPYAANGPMNSVLNSKKPYSGQWNN